MKMSGKAFENLHHLTKSFMPTLENHVDSIKNHFDRITKKYPGKSLLPELQKILDDKILELHDAQYSQKSPPPANPIVNTDQEILHFRQIRIDGIPETDKRSAADILDDESALVESIVEYLSERQTINDLKRKGPYKQDRARPRTLLVTLPQAYNARKILANTSRLT